ncbi:MAG TPA: accessory Sec system translocase SecA2, partial [Clostridiales bacterium]|nr:accessory Sec system translocase SecA2 [Clostridiales bacterium]
MKEAISIRHNRFVETNLKPYRKTLRQIRSLNLDGLTGAEILARTGCLREQVTRGRPDSAEMNQRLNKLLPEAFALVCAAVRKTLGWTAFDSQLLAAAAMQAGRIAELDTGEGKTLSAVFVAYLQALTGRSVHVLTFNDYLASRDAVWMGPVYECLGVRAACVRQETALAERRQAYQANITYLTAKEAGFDYLRGFLAATPDELVQRPFYFAIVDEADSIMIDEARIPLVLAGDTGGPGAIDPALFRLVSSMQVNRHYRLDEYAEHILITESGNAWLEKHLNLTNLYDPENVEILTRIRLILQAIALLRRDVDYIVRGDSIQLVDEFTGRVIQNRQWPDGLHEAVEIKEGLSGRSHGRILNRITLRDFLALYPGLCGMTGTAWSAAAEFYEFYGLRVTRVPPHVPSCRIDKPDLIYARRADKEHAIAEAIVRRHAAGQPILVGTASVEESEYLAAAIRARGLDCEVLNARQDEAEAAVIARAGRRGAITISTNMAGRGVDIQLEDPASGGLSVIGTSRQRSRRIDNQLRGRSGRQGDPGESQFMVSLQDDLIERYHIRDALPPQYRPPDGQPGQESQTGPDIGSEPIVDPAVAEALAHTQRVIEGQLFQQRQALARYS